MSLRQNTLNVANLVLRRMKNNPKIDQLEDQDDLVRSFYCEFIGGCDQ